jgi:hypothetical protein
MTSVTEASALNTALIRLGFNVTLIPNTTREGMLDALDSFGIRKGR